MILSSGLYAYTRNPMYLGHIIFLSGLTLTLRSWLAAVITLDVAVWFHFRMLADERQLVNTTRDDGSATATTCYPVHTPKPPEPI